MRVSEVYFLLEIAEKAFHHPQLKPLHDMAIAKLADVKELHVDSSNEPAEEPEYED